MFAGTESLFEAGGPAEIDQGPVLDSYRLRGASFVAFVTLCEGATRAFK